MANTQRHAYMPFQNADVAAAASRTGASAQLAWFDFPPSTKKHCFFRIMDEKTNKEHDIVLFLADKIILFADFGGKSNQEFSADADGLQQLISALRRSGHPLCLKTASILTLASQPCSPRQQAA